MSFLLPVKTKFFIDKLHTVHTYCNELAIFDKMNACLFGQLVAAIKMTPFCKFLTS